VEPSHLERYVDEQVFRYNHRKREDETPMTDLERFEAALPLFVGKRSHLFRSHRQGRCDAFLIVFAVRAVQSGRFLDLPPFLLFLRFLHIQSGFQFIMRNAHKIVHCAVEVIELIVFKLLQISLPH